MKSPTKNTKFTQCTKYTNNKIIQGAREIFYDIRECKVFFLHIQRKPQNLIRFSSKSWPSSLCFKTYNNLFHDCTMWLWKVETSQLLTLWFREIWTKDRGKYCSYILSMRSNKIFTLTIFCLTGLISYTSITQLRLTI